MSTPTTKLAIADAFPEYNDFFAELKRLREAADAALPMWEKLYGTFKSFVSTAKGSHPDKPKADFAYPLQWPLYVEKNIRGHRPAASSSRPSSRHRSVPSSRPSPAPSPRVPSFLSSLTSSAPSSSCTSCADLRREVDTALLFLRRTEKEVSADLVEDVARLTKQRDESEALYVSCSERLEKERTENEELRQMQSEYELLRDKYRKGTEAWDDMRAKIKQQKELIRELREEVATVANVNVRLQQQLDVVRDEGGGLPPLSAAERKEQATSLKRYLSSAASAPPAQRRRGEVESSS